MLIRIELEKNIEMYIKEESWEETYLEMQSTGTQ